jgi:hypothetical protein
MVLTAEKIQSNWVEFTSNIEKYITGERKQKLLDFYSKYEERIILMPAAHKKEYHAMGRIWSGHEYIHPGRTCIFSNQS